MHNFCSCLLLSERDGESDEETKLKSDHLNSEQKYGQSILQGRQPEGGSASVATRNVNTTEHFVKSRGGASCTPPARATLAP